MESDICANACATDDDASTCLESPSPCNIDPSSSAAGLPVQHGDLLNDCGEYSDPSVSWCSRKQPTSLTSREWKLLEFPNGGVQIFGRLRRLRCFPHRARTAFKTLEQLEDEVERRLICEHTRAGTNAPSTNARRQKRQSMEKYRLCSESRQALGRREFMSSRRHRLHCVRRHSVKRLKYSDFRATEPPCLGGCWTSRSFQQITVLPKQKKYAIAKVWNPQLEVVGFNGFARCLQLNDDFTRLEPKVASDPARSACG